MTNGIQGKTFALLFLRCLRQRHNTYIGLNKTTLIVYSRYSTTLT